MNVVAFLLALLLLPCIEAVVNIHVTLHGKKYHLGGPVKTLGELRKQIEELSGVDPSKQGKILYHGGKLLSSDEEDERILSEMGVVDGDELHCVRGGQKRGKNARNKNSAFLPREGSNRSGLFGVSDSNGNINSNNGRNDFFRYRNMMKAFDKSGDPEDRIRAMHMFKQAATSPWFVDFCNDREKLERCRQMMLTHPMMKTMLSSLPPHMLEILRDEDAFYEKITETLELISEMDFDDLVEAFDRSKDEGLALPDDFTTPGEVWVPEEGGIGIATGANGHNDDATAAKSFDNVLSSDRLASLLDELSDSEIDE